MLKLRLPTITLAMCVAGLAFAALAARPVRAQDDGPIQLRANPIVQADRLQLLREEARERSREIRESRERAKEVREALKHPKKARGRHAEYVQGSDDIAPISPAARAAELTASMRALTAPLNTRANNKIGDSVGNYTAGECEQHIVFKGQYGLAAWNDGRGFYKTVQDCQGVAYTNDGGATWTDIGTPLKGGTITVWTSDPVVAVNEKTGNFYYCGLTTNGTSNGVGVARGHFNGSGVFVWDASTVVASGVSTSYAFDKQWMVADSLNGNLYVSWTRFTSTSSALWTARSTDNGATWSAATQISKSWEAGLASGTRPAVGPNGEVYIAYTAYGAVDADSVKICKSTDFGATWSGPSYVAGTVMDAYFNGAPGFNRGRAITFPSLAVDRSYGANRGRVWIAYHNSVNFYNDYLGTGTANSEVEKNQYFANSTPFTIGQKLRGSISNSSTDTIDNWKFSATQGTTYIFFADSVRTSTFKYTLRIYCPNDTLSVSRLAMSSDGSSSSSVNVHALIVWTAPTTADYYLRMQYSTSTGGYRIQTGTHVASASDGGRDVRDVTVVYSDNGTTAWTVAGRPNDDAALYDNWLPEIAVPTDGYPYVIWMDWRDTPASCFGGSNIYMSRSTDGGASWAGNQAVSTYTIPNWTQTYANIAPNQGDYNGIYGGDCVAVAWADTRPPFAGSNTLGDPDTWTARLLQTFAAGCGSNGQAVVGTNYDLGESVTNNSVMWPLTVNYTLSCDAGWPGFPMTGNATIPAGSVGSVPFSIPVPLDAPNGTVNFCFTATLPNGALQSSCCSQLEVYNPATPTVASLMRASAAGGKVDLEWQLGSASSAVLYRSTDGQVWSSLATLTTDGSSLVRYLDSSVVPGQRYGYRLGVMVSGREVAAGETWVNVPVEAVFALQGVRPNPATGPLSISFSLPGSAPATLSLVDLTGRKVFEQSVGGMGAGFHVVRLERNLPAGLYVVRLSQGGRTLTSKATVVR